MSAGRPLKFQSVEELEQKIEEYFKTTGWILRDMVDRKSGEIKPVMVFEPATITGLAVHLDTSRRTLIDYSEREEFTHAINRAKEKCEHSIEYGALTNQLNPAMAIFSAKNNYGWVDRQEIDQNTNLTGNLTLGDLPEDNLLKKAARAKK